MESLSLNVILNGEPRALVAPSTVLALLQAEGLCERRVAVEVLPSAVVDGGRARVGVSGGDLDVAQRNTRVERGHDERGSQHVSVSPSPARLPIGRTQRCAV